VPIHPAAPGHDIEDLVSLSAGTDHLAEPGHAARIEDVRKILGA
jgi:hypothetical protein